MSFPEETVKVKRYVTVGLDPNRAPVTEPEEEAVSNVLVAPGTLADLGEDRPEGVEVNYTLYFPKTYTAPLEGCEIFVRGEWIPVIGHPDSYDAGFCPTSWNRVVSVGRTHG